ncbi:extracellular cell wall glucanase Crf1/allergen Asp F9 [Pseudovirgaria hyperparasitica]|uniref:chitinase n=1 Tax=Pseudovirgaria hyperparasitica TaxID=470096 RepID=A0A6A6W9X2_9PEZI|nr:extracellular cell wall glucanase Crf1/allergen Asp F9 [Pseudovirgaria hyperparasitica]KAF2758686.1 extracellular cell wall glucanase Crf1/allergen Asp F9 [Pseudovirgaria hyperparasitica]
MQYFTLAVSALPLLFSSAVAQTFTACNPMERDDCPNNAALSTNATFNLTNSQLLDNKIWNTTAGALNWAEKGTEFTVGGRGDSPTVGSKFYLMGGIFSVVMKAAKGRGIVSSIVMQSDDLDEIDWEFIGGNNTHVQTNYFGKGNQTTFDRAIWHPVDDPQNKMHNYTVNWTKEKIDFYIDDDKVRTLNYGDANGGKNFPQTPLNLRLGIWAGGDPEKNAKGTVEWAGGETDFGEAPFTMTVESVYVHDFSDAKEYEFGDRSGSWESIKMVEGQSYAEKRIAEPKGISAHWRALPAGARVGIVAGSVAGFGIAVCALLFFCIKQRRLGRREHARLLEVEEKETQDQMYWKDRINHSPNKPFTA